MKNKFYTVEPNNIQVTKEEFYEFIQNYPRKLVRDVTGICDPPYVSYNDFELANRWPCSVVAATYLYDNEPDGYYYEPEEQRIYRIMKNYQEVFESKTGYKEGD